MANRQSSSQTSRFACWSASEFREHHIKSLFTGDLVAVDTFMAAPRQIAALGEGLVIAGKQITDCSRLCEMFAQSDRLGIGHLVA